MFFMETFRQKKSYSMASWSTFISKSVFVLLDISQPFLRYSPVKTLPCDNNSQSSYHAIIMICLSAKPLLNSFFVFVSIYF